MNWSTLFSDLFKIVEAAVPIASLEGPEAAAIAGAVGTIVTTLANKAAKPAA